MFRKFYVLCMVLFLTVNLSGCIVIPGIKTIEVRDEDSAIVSIEVYDLGDGGYCGRFYGMDDDIDRMEEEHEPVKVLDTAQYPSLIEKLESLVFDNTDVIILAPTTPSYYYNGYTVKITYENGNYDILSANCQLFDSGEDYSEKNYNYDQDKWNELIEAYLVEIPTRPALTTEE